ncbi:MAG: hypothetical protein J0L60_14855 [Ignavibacteria bacterium]|nr:hypothetical protein [Ignavibacteria bacterium]
MKTNYYQKLVLISFLIYFAGCNGEEKSKAWEGFNPYSSFGESIVQYHRATQNYSIEKPSDNPKVYIDFSDGLVQAYTSNPANKEIIQAITNKLVSTDAEWFSLGNSKIEKLNYSSNELFNKVTNPSAYKDNMAPIQEALKQIVELKNDALLVTDFEEYTSDGKEQFENYPKKYFIEWLKAGNSITFFYTDFDEKNAKSGINTKKHLFFTVFTYGLSTDKSLVKKVEDALAGRNATKKFELGGTPFILKNKYDGNESSGIANKEFKKWVNYNFNGLKENGDRFEVIGINKVWNDDLEEYVKNIIEKENGVFLSNLMLNAEDKSYYSLKSLIVNVYDITENFEKFTKYSKIKQTVPQFTTDEGKNKVWDKSSQTNTLITECYEKNSDKIKSDWVFTPAKLTDLLWNEIFELDGQIFKDHLKNDPGNIELKTKFHKNYKKKNVKKENALLRVDIVYDDIEFNSTNEKLKDFEWQSATQKDKVNNSLLEAIRNTLQDPEINPKGKALYTYYIKFGATQKKD